MSFFCGPLPALKFQGCWPSTMQELFLSEVAPNTVMSDDPWAHDGSRSKWVASASTGVQGIGSVFRNSTPIPLPSAALYQSTAAGEPATRLPSISNPAATPGVAANDGVAIAVNVKHKAQPRIHRAVDAWLRETRGLIRRLHKVRVGKRAPGGRIHSDRRWQFQGEKSGSSGTPAGSTTGVVASAECSPGGGCGHFASVPSRQVRGPTCVEYGRRQAVIQN